MSSQGNGNGFPPQDGNSHDSRSQRPSNASKTQRRPAEVTASSMYDDIQSNNLNNHDDYAKREQVDPSLVPGHITTHKTGAFADVDLIDDMDIPINGAELLAYKRTNNNQANEYYASIKKQEAADRKKHRHNQSDFDLDAKGQSKKFDDFKERPSVKASNMNISTIQTVLPSGVNTPSTSSSISDYDLDDPTISEKERKRRLKKIANKNKEKPPLMKFFSFVMKNYYTRILIGILIPMIILAVPIVLVAIFSHDATMGGTSVIWFFFWLELIYLAFWCTGIIARFIPKLLYNILFIDKIKTILEITMALEKPIAIFLWCLTAFVSFKPVMTLNPVNKKLRQTNQQSWHEIVFHILTAMFIASILFLIEKFLIQMLAVKFHERTYKERIAKYKSDVKHIALFYKFSKSVLPKYFEDVDNFDSVTGNGRLSKVRKFAKAKFGGVGGSLGTITTGDGMNYYQRIVQEALSDNYSASGMARRFIKAFSTDGENIHFEDILKHAKDRDLARRIFSVFDTDLSGDINFEEIEATCCEIGNERKCILRSLRDVDSAVEKFDNILTFIVFVISLIILAQLLSNSVQSYISSASTSLLALSWLFSATAQEILAAVLFVFAKHPFDVEDTIEFNGNRYTVKEMQLLATVFVDSDGKIMQAPNNVLNQLYIFNYRRSDKIGEGVTVKCWFGTPMADIEALRLRMVAFTENNRKEFCTNVMIFIAEYPRLEIMKLNVYFNHKTNWQNTLPRLKRKNRFIAYLRECIDDLGISLEPPTKPKREKPLTVPKVPLTLPKEEDVPHHIYRKMVDARNAYMGQIRGKDLEGKIDNGFIPNTAELPMGETQALMATYRHSNIESEVDSDIESEVDSDIDSESDLEPSRWLDKRAQQHNLSVNSKTTNAKSKKGPAGQAAAIKGAFNRYLHKHQDDDSVEARTSTVQFSADPSPYEPSSRIHRPSNDAIVTFPTTLSGESSSGSPITEEFTGAGSTGVPSRPESTYRPQGSAQSSTREIADLYDEASHYDDKPGSGPSGRK